MSKHRSPQHSYREYECKYCDTKFVPIPQASTCPKCNHKAKVVFPDFVKETIDSAKNNLTLYKCFVPPAWLSCTMGDVYYSKAFGFLEYSSNVLKMSKKDFISQKFSKAQIDRMTSQYLALFDFGNKPYWIQGFETYLSLLLVRETE